MKPSDKFEFDCSECGATGKYKDNANCPACDGKGQIKCIVVK